jgi:hypothetical protein
MSDLRLVYLSGEPGVGKSTLMREITADWERIYLPKEPGKAPHRDLLFDRGTPNVCCAVELGRLRESASGTDALEASCITEAETWLHSGQAARESSLILAEGSHLAHRRFLTDAVQAGWRVQLLHLQGPNLAAHRRSARTRVLDRPENQTWIKNRRTAAANLALHASAWGVEVLLVDAARLVSDHDYHDAIIGTARGTLHTNLTPL